MVIKPIKKTMEKNLTTIGICAFLALIGYAYVQQAEGIKKSESKTIELKDRGAKSGVYFDGEINYSCTDKEACNYNENAKDNESNNKLCEYKKDICDTCSGETDGSGTVIDNDYNNDGICDQVDNETMEKIIRNKEVSDSLTQVQSRTIDLYIGHGSDERTISTNVIIDGSKSYDPENDTMYFNWSTKDNLRFKKTEKVIQFPVISKKDSIETYKVNLELTDSYKDKAGDYVIINVHGERNENPVPVINAIEVEVTEEKEPTENQEEDSE